MELAGIPPQQTLYVNNLNDKVKKLQLKRSLYHIFSQYGSVMDIVAMKTARMRGQAWIVFEDIASASIALRQLQGFPFYDKPMRLQFAKAKSRAVELQQGKYKKKKRKQKEKKHIGPPKKVAAEPEAEADSDTAAVPMLTDGSAEVAEAPVDQGPATKILMCSDLPERCNEGVLEALFKQFAGLKEIRLIAGKRMAFIEFENEDQADVAMKALQNFRLTKDENLKLKFAQ